MKILPLTSGVKPGAAELAEKKLHESPYYFLRRLTCDYRDGVITLRGQVPLEQLRTCAESIVARVDGVREVINCIEIGHPGDMVASAERMRSAG